MGAPGHVPPRGSKAAAIKDGEGTAVLDALAREPGGPELLDAAASATAGSDAGAEVALVGGAVRDLLLDNRPRELDVVAGGDVPALARELAARLGATASETHHERFGTALIVWDGGRIDIARRRAESYPSPGALPLVREGSAEEDLRRRDFTVNALAVPLAGERQGELLGVEHALDDLREGCLRVLHDASFSDDPTRLLRLARYSARLGFGPEQQTAQLAARALTEGALGTVSGARSGAELRLALTEPQPLGALRALAELGGLRALDGALALDAATTERALALLGADASRAVLLLGALLRAGAGDRDADGEAAAHARALLDRLEFASGDRDRAIETAFGAPALAAAMHDATRPSQLHDALQGCPPEAVALAGALDPAVADAAREWLSRLRHVRLQITGDDLLAAGIAAGPELGARLAAALRMRLDGELADGREAELRAALQERA